MNSIFVWQIYRKSFRIFIFVLLTFSFCYCTKFICLNKSVELYSLKKRKRLMENGSKPLEKFDDFFLYFEIGVMFGRKTILYRSRSLMTSQRPRNIIEFILYRNVNYL